MQQGAQFLVRSSGLSLVMEAGDRGGRVAVAREADGVEAEQAKLVAVQAVGVGMVESHTILT